MAGDCSTFVKKSPQRSSRDRSTGYSGPAGYRNQDRGADSKWTRIRLPSGDWPDLEPAYAVQCSSNRGAAGSGPERDLDRPGQHPDAAVDAEPCGELPS